MRFVINDGWGRGELLFVILVEIADKAEVAEMPVEEALILVSASGDGGHDNISAIAGIAGDCEVPGLLGLGGGSGEMTEKRERRCAEHWEMIPLVWDGRRTE